MRVHYISPYSREKNIGKAINDAVMAIDADIKDWFVLTDHDVLFLLPDSKKQLEEILGETRGHVIGTMTNRCGIKEQCYNSYVASHSNMKHHIAIAMMLQMDIGNKVEETEGDLAAFCLCFKKQVWLDVGGFIENSLQFDRQFVRIARKLRYRIGIARGLYLFHLYRFLSEDPTRESSHLKP